MSGPELMPPERAERIRAEVWPGWMREQFAETPGAFTACACQYGMTGWCANGEHGRCGRAEPLAMPPGIVTRRRGSMALLPQRFEHPAPTATGPKPSSVAMVWYADRVCRWRCSCPCHTASGPPATRTRSTTTRPVPIPAGQDTLF